MTEGDREGPDALGGGDELETGCGRAGRSPGWGRSKFRETFPEISRLDTERKTSRNISCM
eukprot:3921758-Prymnesium_polylepis.1